MEFRIPHDRTLGPTIFVVALASLYAAAVAVAFFNLQYLYSIPLIVGTLFPLVLYGSNNPRLFLFIAMIFTAPLGLSINFRGHPHMGGAFAFSIYLMDFLMVPLIAFMARDYYRGERRVLRLSPVSGWWLGMIGLGMLSIVIGPFREQAAFEVARMIHLWILFVVIVNECVREKHFHYAIVAIAANIAVNVLVAMIQYLLKHDLGLQALGEASAESGEGADLGVYGIAGEVFRPGGLAGHTNLLAAYLAMTLPIFIALLYTDYGRLMKAGLTLLIIAGVAILGLTLSRSGWASFSAAMLLLTIGLFTLPGLRRRHLLLKAGMIATMGAGLVVGSGLILRRLTQSDPGALDFRFEWVMIAWEMVKDRPVFGFGLNTFVYNLVDYAPYTVPRMYELFGEMWPAVHNAYMLVWSEQGTVGLLLFIGLHASILSIAVKNLAYRGLSQKVYMISLAGACGVVAIMVDGLSSFYVRVPAPARTFWIVVALIVAARYWNERNAQVRGRLAAQREAALDPAAPSPDGATRPT